MFPSKKRTFDGNMFPSDNNPSPELLVQKERNRNKTTIRLLYKKSIYVLVVKKKDHRSLCGFINIFLIMIQINNEMVIKNLLLKLNLISNMLIFWYR